MTKEMEGHVGPHDIGGAMKEVRQVYRSPAQMEKGKNSNREGTDVRPKEVSDVEMHVAMEQLFQERSASIS